MSVDVPGEKPLAEPGGTEKRGGGFRPPSEKPKERPVFDADVSALPGKGFCYLLVLLFA